MAREVGNAVYANVVAIGVLAGIFKIELIAVNDLLVQYFASKDQATIDNNIKAAAKGYGFAQQLDLSFELGRDPAVTQQLVMSGAEALALGAMAGGCNFIAAYPMTPSTSTFTFLAQQARALGIVIEQAE